MIEEIQPGFEIIEDDFKMIYNGGSAFDLYFRKNKKSEWKFRGYGMQLNSCIKAIIYNRIDSKYNELDFKTFFMELKQMYYTLSQQLKEITGHDY